MMGRMEKTMSVMGRLEFARMTKETAIFKNAETNSSGKWWANSVTSFKSEVMRLMSCPILVLS